MKSGPCSGGAFIPVSRDRSAALSCQLAQHKQPARNRRSSPVKTNFSTAQPGAAQPAGFALSFAGDAGGELASLGSMTL